MTNRVSLVLVLLFACASAAPSVRSANSPTSPAVSEQLQAYETAQMQAQTDQLRALELAGQQAKEQVDADRQAKAAALRAKCEPSRADRVEHAKLMMGARMKAETRLLNASKAVKASCKLGAKPTGAIRVDPSGSGFRVAPEMADDVHCGGRLPTGLTKDDAYVILWRIRDHGDAAPTGHILETEDHSELDDECSGPDADAKAGIADLFGQTWESMLSKP